MIGLSRSTGTNGSEMTLLLRAEDNPNSNGYKRGDVIHIAPTSQTWGSRESLPPSQGGPFIRLTVTGVTRSALEGWVGSVWTTQLAGEDGLTRRRRVKIDLNLLPVAVQNSMAATGAHTMRWRDLRGYMRNKETNTTAVNAILGGE
jgi:hypothetical protein